MVVVGVVLQAVVVQYYSRPAKMVLALILQVTRSLTWKKQEQVKDGPR